MIIKDFKEIHNEIIDELNYNYKILCIDNKAQEIIDNILVKVFNYAYELEVEYENLEADYDECLDELSDAIEENKILRTCFINQSEIISEQRNKINELKYIINDSKTLKVLVKELSEYE